jgi:membrane associated rhomboid family serine protease
VLNLIIANFVVFLATMLYDNNMLYGNFAMFNIDFRCLGEEHMTLFEPWQPLTYMFMHGGFSHLFFNMFSLWMFGRTLEWELGWKRFLTYYMVCGVGAALFQMGVAQIDLSNLEVGTTAWAMYMSVPTVGASGAIFGLLLAFGMMHPNAIISLIFPPISMKAKWFVVVYGALELLLGVSGTMDNVAHFAHLGGMFWGWLLLMWWRRRDRQRNIFYY